jgi:transposase
MTFTSREEREQYVIELYKQGKTIREIAQLVHMSFSSIGTIIKKYTGYDNNDKPSKENENGKKESVSDSTKAFKLFSQGKTPVQVAIKLDVEAEEVNVLYRQYWHLKGLYQLNSLYEEMKSYLPEYTKLFLIMKKHGLKSEQQIVNTIKCAPELPSLRDKVQKLKWDAEIAEAKKTAAESEWASVQKKVWTMNNEMMNIQSVLDQKVHVVNCLENQLARLRSSINTIIDSEVYLKIQERQQESQVLTQLPNDNGDII